ncbi:MAG: DEAD/DEAH box helicase [Prevotellaceae bacterium]|jgi:SNF2 family DNA or RNA helicase|nr:DEAD/DEAH box helicase [Prevotellaceae bacterium]
MIEDLIQRYQSFDEDSRKIVNFLALTYEPLTVDDLAKIFPDIGRDKIDAVTKQEMQSKILIMSPYGSGYVADVPVVVWLFPLIYSKEMTIYSKRSIFGYYFYNKFRYDKLFNFLTALFFYPEKLTIAERELTLYNRDQLHEIASLFLQPAYDEHLPKLNKLTFEMIYSNILSKTIERLGSFELLQIIERKMTQSQVASLNLNSQHAEMAMAQGNFKLAQQLSTTYSYYNEMTNPFAEAIIDFLKGDISESLAMFEQGMRKQRRSYRSKYLPVDPETAMFYIAAYLMKGEEYYKPVFRKITEEKGKTPTTVYSFFRKVCEYYLQDASFAEKTVVYLQSSKDAEPEQILWRAVAVGMTEKSLDMEVQIAKYTRQAFENKHYVIAYETAYLLTKWFPDPEYKQLFDNIAARLKYKPALAQIVRLEEWERQLNSFFTLDAVRMVANKDVDNDKARVAYRFFPNQLNATPILQTRNASGVWSAGRNIAMRSFVEGKVDGMTWQDRNIATSETRSSYSLGRNAIYEMVGHPYVYLEHSDIPVELIATQPVINVVKSAGNTYKMECDISNPHEGVIIVKETNTRYKVYKITRFQCDIINAISKSKPVPERGYEKLMEIVKHFSVYIQVQSELVVDENDVQARQVEPDSRIRVQLLPIGDGIKAELFVKPFGSHPPYCKPGRGGRALIAAEEDERVRVTRNLNDEMKYNRLILDDIRAIGNIKTSDEGLMTFDNPLDTLELLEILQRHQDISVVEWPEGERLKIRKKITGSNLSLRVKSNINWFELEGELKVDENTVLTVSTLLEMIRQSHGRFVELSNGEFLALTEQLRRRLSEIADVAAESKDKVIINRFASASLIDVFDDFENVSIDKAWHDFRKRLQTAQLTEAPVPLSLQTELRPYQVSGFQWMIRLSEWGAGACLADDMGLGKTVQTIAVLLHRAHIGAALVVSPVSVMPNWISEVNRFAPSLNVKILRNNNERAVTLASLNAGDLLVTSYGLLLSEEEIVTAKRWATVVLDEAHAIKNFNTQTSKAAMLLQSDFRVILTGTPIQNHLGEIWNLFQFINPGLLGSLSHFTETFVRPDNEKTRERLKKMITPFILRRTKTAVLDELPPKTEIVRKITLSNEEMAFYETLRRNALKSLEKDDSTQGAKHLKALAEITRLRQACCNPALISPDITIESTKLSTFLEIASELKENGHRALVFSQFVTHLSLIRKALDKDNYTYCYLDGSTPMARRDSEVRRFQGGYGDFFLISLKAGGLGLNLTAADYVIHLDPWWNPAIEDQASDRAHRIGQNRPVTVYRLVAEQTIEEKIIQLHNTKRDLADSLLEGSDQSAKLSINELMELIKN